MGCGVGWSTTALAAAYPAVRVDGFDLDPAAWNTVAATPPTLGWTTG